MNEAKLEILRPVGDSSSQVKEISIDQKLLEVEKEIRRVRSTPKEIEIKCQQDMVRD